MYSFWIVFLYKRILDFFPVWKGNEGPLEIWRQTKRNIFIKAHKTYYIFMAKKRLEICHEWEHLCDVNWRGIFLFPLIISTIHFVETKLYRHSILIFKIKLIVILLTEIYIYFYFCIFLKLAFYKYENRLDRCFYKLKADLFLRQYQLEEKTFRLISRS